MKKSLFVKLAAVAVAAAVFVPLMAGEMDLSGTWRLEGSDGKGAAISCPIAVPGDVHSALFKAKLIPDPFWGDNEKQTQWVGRHDWTVVRTFEVDEATLAKEAVVLRLEDVDLFATVFVNGYEVGRTDDRYCRWEFNVKPYLKKGANELKGVFGSSENAVPALAKAYEPRTFNMACAETRWLKSLSLLRKPACHGGWDWGLAQMITGFCGDVKLLAYDDFKIDYVYSDQKFNDDFTHCDLTVYVDVADANGKSSTVTNRVSIDNPPLWWPNGAGEQKFYVCTLDVRGRKIEKRIGLRKIEVLNTPDVDANGKPGARMAFRVNGREIFMKGADWIPCSAFDAEQTPARYRDLVQSAAAANMNMLRVWGGGQFEKDAFYDACDEAGILLWHDFMFSCALYPGDDVFLGKLRGELRHQLRRLRDHASIALWCGDNECVGALGWWHADDKEKALRRTEFERRCAVMGECIGKYDPARQFWPSSPCAGPGNYADNWHNDSFGDMHLWTVWHENKPFSDYYRYHPRFCSEFGFQSFSSPEVAETFATKEDIAAHAPAFEWHQKNIGGNDRIRKTMARYFRSPKDAVSELLLSQFQQGLAIRTAVENWRTQRPRCMGTLFWQLNDNWPVASWSSVEYGGKWKPLHHLARRFFAPVWVVANPDGQVVALNDTAEALAGDLTLEYWTYGGKILSSETKSVSLAPDAATVVGSCASPKDAPAFLVMTLKTSKGTVRNDWHFAAYKDVPVAKAKVEAKIEGLKVTLSTDKPTFFVWANARGVRGEFDDNCFTLLPGRPITLTFGPKGSVDPSAFARALTVEHLATVTE